MHPTTRSDAPAFPEFLAALSALSARLGADRTLVQGAGGNTSLKHGDALWVKASGTWLSAALEQPVFVGLNLREVLRRLAAGEADPALPALLDPAMALRPSIETTLHALLPHRVVLHVHSVNAIAFAVRSDGPALVAERLAGLRWAWVPYARPGLPLTRAVQAVLQQNPDVLLLGNHGLVVGGADETAAAALLQEVEVRLSLSARPAPAPDAQQLAALAAASGGEYRPAAIMAAHGAATDPHCFSLAGRGALYPDHTVFLGASPVPTLSFGQAMRWLAETGSGGRPALVLVAGIGALLRTDLSAGAQEMATCLGLVLARVAPDAPLVVLDAMQEAELLDWDAEKYRQSLNLMPG
jgi:rhamnose utilization protein RhaD (predicted bifunctional aldolase and dehydrogenase)